MPNATPLIVAGCPRSGTTTMAHVLGILHEHQFSVPKAARAARHESNRRDGRRHMGPESKPSQDVDCTETGRKPRVVFGILTQGATHHVLTSRVPDLTRHPVYEIVFVTLNERPIEHVRNKLAKIALDHQAQWLLMIDADNPPVRNPYDLIAFDKDVVACPTPMYKRIAGQGGVYWNTGMDTEDGRVRIDGIHKGNELKQRDIVGTGCILIRRNVLEAVRPPFVCDWDADGLRIASSDWTFCRRARAQGFEVWAHYGYPCRHFSEVELSEITELDYPAMLRASESPIAHLPHAPPIL